jgi:hypothetical protein
MKGFGDLIAWFLIPLQPLIKRFYGKKDCGCKKRQEALNRILPFSNKGMTEQEIKDWNERRDRRFNRNIKEINKINEK